MSFQICSGCRRHIKSSDCPFCAKARRPSLSVGLALAITATTLGACAKEPAPVAPDPTTATATNAQPATPEPAKPGPVTEVLTTSTPAEPPPAAPTTPPTSVASAKPNPQPVWNKPQPTAPVPDRPIMARYGVAPNFPE